MLTSMSLQSLLCMYNSIKRDKGQLSSEAEP